MTRLLTLELRDAAARSARATTLFVPLLLLACGEKEAPPLRRAIPVEVLELRSAQPALPAALTGVAIPFREEDVAFEVSGRVQAVPEVGDEVRGPVLDEKHQTVEEGQIIATLARTRAEQARDAAALSLATARKGLEAQQLESDAIVRAELDRAVAAQRAAKQLLVSAEAELANRRSTFKRVEGLLRAGSANQQRYDNEKALLDGAIASVERYRQDLVGAQAAAKSARANVELRKLQTERSEAEVAEAAQALKRAEQDVIDCELRAPFTGRITALHSSEGSIVSAGTRVATLTMMNPLKVTVTVNADTSRKLVPGKQAKIVPHGIAGFTDEDFLIASVWSKAEVADSNTRTYQVDFVVRNIKRDFAKRSGNGVASIRDLMPIIQPQLARQAKVPLYVFSGCIGEEDGENFVYRLPGVSIEGRGTVDMTKVFRPERIVVRKVAKYLTFVDYTFVAIEDGSGLNFGDYVILSPEAAQLEGASIAGFDWLIRPGELVPVSFDAGTRAEGFYVPVEAIRHREGVHSVFAVTEGEVVRELQVTVHESTGRTRRIEGEGLREGVRIITRGRHYVVEGDRVQVMQAQKG